MKPFARAGLGRQLRALFAAITSFSVLCCAPGVWAQSTPLRISVVTFLSGPGAGGMGLPSRNAAELTFDALNAGALPEPYGRKGFGGRPIELVLLDEAGSTSNVVTQYRNLVQRQEVAMVIGYISSASCLAIAPVADELKMLTVFFDCGTPRIFEEADYKYVFRTQAHATMDSVAAAKYVRERFPKATRIAGLNQNYAWGQDSWRDFEMSMRALLPGVQVATSQMPKLFSGQFGAEISVLLGSNADIVHSSFWGGDLEAFILQAVPRDLFGKSVVVFPAGESSVHKMKGKIPDGTIIGARGNNSLFAPDNALNRWFRAAYEKRYAAPPAFTAYHMVQAILGAKAAYEKAQGAKDVSPSTEQIIAAFEDLSFETPGGTARMALGKGHQAIQGTAYGMTRTIDGVLTMTGVTRYAAEEVNPPKGVKSEDWIRSGFKR